jgi:hypothetical protein
VRRLKLFLATLGFCLAATAVAVDHRGLAWSALAALVGALGVRLWERHRPPPPES